MARSIASLSKMWHKILTIEKTLFPALKETLRAEELSSKESKLIRILDFAEIERNITVVTITNSKKSREQIARAFVAKSIYNFQTTRDFRSFPSVLGGNAYKNNSSKIEI